MDAESDEPRAKQKQFKGSLIFSSMSPLLEKECIYLV
jgi:hypothetical protein